MVSKLARLFFVVVVVVVVFFFPANILMALILPLPVPSSAAHGHCCFCSRVTSGPQTAESAAALSPSPALSLHSGWQKQLLLQGSACSLSFPKLCALLGGQGGSGTEWEAGTPLGSCLVLFRSLFSV